MKPVTSCLFLLMVLAPASQGSFLRPAATGRRSIVPSKEVKEPLPSAVGRANLTRPSVRVSGKGRYKKPRLFWALGDWFRSSSPGSESWPSSDNETFNLDPGEYGHAKNVPQWGGHEPPISDEDFCTAMRAMGWIARNIIPATEKIRPENATWVGEGVKKQKGEAVIVLRMMMAWQKLLIGLQRQLKWTPKMDSQMHCALCYKEYSTESANWLVVLRKQAELFKKDDKFRNIMFQRLNELCNAHSKVAKLLHSSRLSGSLIKDKIPTHDHSGFAARIHKLYGIGSGAKLQKWMQKGDPAHPIRVGGLFKETKDAWVYERGEQVRERAVIADEGLEADNEDVVRRDSRMKADSILEANFDEIPLKAMVSALASRLRNSTRTRHYLYGRKDKDNEGKEEGEDSEPKASKCKIRKCGFRDRFVCSMMGWDYCVCGPGCTQADAHLLFDKDKDKNS